MSRNFNHFNRFGQTSKRMGYTLLDNAYFDSLKLVTDELNREDLSYAIVGGCGTQIYVSKIISGAQPINRSQESLKYVLRPTSDVDLVSYEDTFPEFVAASPHIFENSGFAAEVIPKGIKLKRGSDSVTFQCVNRASGLQDINQYMISKAQEVPITKGHVTAYPIVASPEYIVAAKLTQEGRLEKHIADVHNMLNAFKHHNFQFDPEEVRTMLKAVGKERQMEMLYNIMHC